MKNIAQGLSLKKYKGNKHKDGGIMVNALGNKTKDVNKAVAEVEGGEYNYRYNPNNPKDNYILSEQLGIADMAKQADRFKGNNRIDYNTRTNLLNKSMKLNEMLRVQQEQQPMQMALGGELKDVNPFDKQPPKQKDSDFRRVYQSTPMNIVKIFDPTGISSYPDVAYSIDDYNKGKGSKTDIALNVLGALPVIGKVKALGTLAKGTSNSKKALNIVTKLGDLAGDIERFPTKVIKESTDRARKPIAKLINKTSTSVLNFNDVIRNKIVPPFNPNQFSTKSATKSDMINAGTSLVNIGNLGSDINSVSKKQFGGKLKKYINGGLTKGAQSIVGSMVANSKANDLTKIATAPEIKLGTTTAPKLETNPIALPTLPTTAPKTTAEAANTGMQVNTQNDATPEPVIEKNKKNNFKGALSAVSGAVSALGPIGQGVGAAMQLAPYAIDLGKAMFDKTSVQDLQTQGSAMRLPNTTYAKNGGKLNLKPLPKFGNGTNLNKDRNPFDKIEKKEGTVSSGKVDMLNPFYRRTEQTRTPSTKITGTIPLGRVVDMNNPFNRNNPSVTQGTVSSGRVEGNPFDTRMNPVTTTGTMKNRRLEVNPFTKDNPLFNKLPIPPIVDTDNPFNRNRDLVDPFNLNKDKKKSTVTEEKNTQVNTTDNKDNAGKNKGNAGSGKGSSKGSTGSNSTSTTTSTNMLPSRGLMLPGASSIVQAAKARFDKDNLERAKEYDALVGNALSKFNAKGVTTPTTTGTTENTEVPQSESSRLFKAGQNKQKLSEALMYGMAALPSEQIKTITPDYGRGDDAMSRMGLSTEPIRQEMMQGANKALELTRSQVGTAGQLQSRGQSIMSNLSSQLSQSQIQQQQYLNQLRGALAQREDTKANVLAQSQLTAREAKSAERAAKLDQLNNAISQTSAIGAGTMEQASKMSTIENENERFNKQQERLLDIFNKSGNFKVSFDKDGKITYDYVGNTPAQSNIKQVDLSNPLVANNAANTGTSTTPASNAVVPAATTTGTTHTIKKGDTLYAIAKANNTTVSNLVKLNGFKNDRALILPGQTIKIK